MDVEEKNPSGADKETKEIQNFFILIPSGTTLKELFRALFDLFPDLSPDSGETTITTHKATERFRRYHLPLVVFEEIQHFNTRRPRRHLKTKRKHKSVN